MEGKGHPSSNFTPATGQVKSNTAPKDLYQWSGDSARYPPPSANMNGYGPPPSVGHVRPPMAGASPRQQFPPSAPIGQHHTAQPVNGSGPHGYPPQRPSYGGVPPTSTGHVPYPANQFVGATQPAHVPPSQASDLGRPSELPVPFHGQGQYSHQVNPLMQKTPVQSPGNSGPPSEKSSRGPSPVSGSTIDALEGQFTPGHGAPSPLFPMNQGSPLSGSPVPTSTPPSSGTPPRPGSTGAPQRFANTQPQIPSSLNQRPTGQPMTRFGPPPPSTQTGGFISHVAPGTIQPQPRGVPPTSQSMPPATNAFPTSTIGTNIQRFPPSSVSTPNASRFPLNSITPGLQSNQSGFPPLSNTSGYPPQPAPATSNSANQAQQNMGMGKYPPPPGPNTGPFQQQNFGHPSGNFPPTSGSFAPPPSNTVHQNRFPPPPNYNTGRYPPPSASNPGGLPPPPTSNVPRFPTGPLPPSNSAGLPPHPSGLPPPPSGLPPQPSGLPPPPSGLPPPPSGVPGYTPSSQSGLPPPPGMPMAPGGSQSNTNKYPTPSYMQPGVQPPGPAPYPNSNITQGMGQMGIQDAQRTINLLSEKNLIAPEGVETAKPTLPHDFKKVNCSPDIFRCTLNAIPQTSALLNKARLPLGILIHPFKDLSQLPVIQSSVIVRCRACRTYINPFVVFVDQRRWKCNLCFRVNELPDEFSFDPVTKTYGDPQRRPEVKSATIEFIAPSEYMLRPPQPAVYLYLLDVSINAIETGYLSQFCQILLDELEKIPGDARTSIGFLCYDQSLYYFNLAEGLSQPQMLVVPDLEDPFLPCPDNLLVNLQESKELVIELLNQLPSLFEGTHETGSALGAALQSAHKLMSPTGGRITVMQTCLPTVGPGALENREVSGDSGKNCAMIGPATDFYKKLSLDCSAQQIAVDLFMFNGVYADHASLCCISKYSAGCIYYYPSFHTVRNPGLVDKFDSDFRRYLTRKIGFESVMRIRCTRGLSIHTFHGNFFVRSTDLLSLPNINPDAGFGMQMSIEDNLQDSTTISFQAALLYTSSKGERRIRVHTLCVPVSNQMSEIFAGADQQAIVGLLAKMAVDRSLNSAISDARDAMMNASLDALGAFAQQIPASQRSSSNILAPYGLRLMPMYMLSMLKSVAFSLAGNPRLDTRVFAMQQCKTLPLCYLLQTLYPHLYPLHRLDDENPIKKGKEEIPRAPLLQLSSANIDRTGIFLMDTVDAMYVLVGSGIGDQMCQDVFDKPNVASIPDGLMDLPELDNPTSERIRSFVNYLMDSRPNGVTFLILRDDSKHRHLFFQHMLEDRTENSMSYYEFLQFLQGKAK